MLLNLHSRDEARSRDATTCARASEGGTYADGDPQRRQLTDEEPEPVTFYTIRSTPTFSPSSRTKHLLYPAKINAELRQSTSFKVYSLESIHLLPTVETISVPIATTRIWYTESIG